MGRDDDPTGRVDDATERVDDAKGGRMMEREDG